MVCLRTASCVRTKGMEIDKERRDERGQGALPRHIGIIMDGNGRWARERGLPRTVGHEEGLNAAKRTVKAASDLGIRYLTLYAFSTENWKRTREEVSFLMRLIRLHLRRELSFYKENGIRVVHSGDLSGLPKGIRKEIEVVARQTEAFTGTTVNLAINYGGRDEIIRAVNRWLDTGGSVGASRACLTAGELSRFLDRPEMPDPDVIIRTSGEKRLSNFLLWQAAYAELYFSRKLWPDFGPEDLRAAVADYQLRNRRFGTVLPELVGTGRSGARSRPAS